jgi:predicted N-acyltransferase
MPTLRLLDSLAEIPEQHWNSLHDGSNPFLSHAFLSGLEQHGCLKPRWGWKPLHAALFDRDRLIAAAPGYLKTNSHGEFVFDHAWAHAYARHGLDYYPKWLLAVPYTPVTGPRLLAGDDATRKLLVMAMQKESSRRGLSSIHVNFLPESEIAAFPDRWLARSDVQFHWRNDVRWQTFEDFLAALESKKRKNIRQEREQVRRAGVVVRTVNGHDASDEDLIAMHGFYCMTFSEKGNHPALTLDFFRHLARTMPERLLIVLAEKGKRTIAGAFFLRGRSRHLKHMDVRMPRAQDALERPASRDDQRECTATSASMHVGDDTLYGRYWGAEENLPGLHFECCYYQGIEICLREGIAVFEPGAQGEHKIARGFLPVLTHSRHFIDDERFAEALQPWCAEEMASVLRYRDLVMQHSPYREPSANYPART